MHETKFEDDSEITSYLATGYAEGFEEASCPKDVIRAWSYLCGTRIGYGLQGWFGRAITNLIEQGIMDENGTVDWEQYDELIQ